MPETIWPSPFINDDGPLAVQLFLDIWTCIPLQTALTCIMLEVCMQICSQILAGPARVQQTASFSRCPDEIPPATEGYHWALLPNWTS